MQCLQKANRFRIVTRRLKYVPLEEPSLIGQAELDAYFQQISLDCLENSWVIRPTIYTDSGDSSPRML